MIIYTSAPLAPTAMVVPGPTRVMADSSDREGCEIHDDFAWMEYFSTLHEMTGERSSNTMRVGSACRDHGTRRPLLGFRTTATGAA